MANRALLVLEVLEETLVVTVSPGRKVCPAPRELKAQWEFQDHEVPLAIAAMPESPGLKVPTVRRALKDPTEKWALSGTRVCVVMQDLSDPRVWRAWLAIGDHEAPSARRAPLDWMEISAAMASLASVECRALKARQDPRAGPDLTVKRATKAVLVG